MVLILSRKHIQNGQSSETPAPQAGANGVSQTWTNGSGNVVINPSEINNPNSRRWSGSHSSSDPESGHVPHAICKLYRENTQTKLTIKTKI